MVDINSTDVSHSKIDAKCGNAIRKRRSSIFQSRLISFNEHEENEKDTYGKDPRNLTPEKTQEEAFDLEEYINSLKTERKGWIETLKQRRAQRRILANKKLCLESKGQPIDLSVLSDTEKAFLTARPNYQHICQSIHKLSDISSKVSLVHQLVYELNERFILQMERRVHKVTEKLIDASES